ncbi:ankyrin repeat-containing domain protein [Sphaerosporella brunnea]|uniref:Ankyrin repeat-containing domain protein n=1 Tax=Sphaerosporella brunnea TaxID=1250544 RepID=A0A5J5EUU3_9PEZI|nr:ankyrin repeat-containing domain protein [Sphaerosporella brunnea]
MPRARRRAASSSTSSTSSTSSVSTTITSPDASPPKASLLTLPPELIFSITTPLPRASIHALTLTHPRLHFLLNHQLFSPCFVPPGLLVSICASPRRLWRPILLLLPQPQQVHEVDAAGWTPLHWAARRGDAELVRLLLESGADVDAVTDAGRGALHHAAMATARGAAECVDLLLQAGAGVAERDDAGVGVLEMAVRTGCAVRVRRLLMAGARAEGAWGVAVREGKWEVLEVLREWGWGLG